MKKRVLSALLALCLTLSLAGAAFAENETLSPAQETSVSESASSAAEPQEEKESEGEAEEISTAETVQEAGYPAQDFEAAVDSADVEYDGFVVLDISFVDTDGNKVEPL